MPINYAGTMNITTPGEREIVIERDFGAPRTLVWDAYTKPELVRRWLLGPPGWTMPVCEIDLRPGGRYRYLWRAESGSEMGLTGVYREIWKPEKIVNTELFEPDWTSGENVSVLTLEERQGRTTVTAMITYASAEVREAALQTGMAEGMKAGLDRLEAFLGELQEQGG